MKNNVIDILIDDIFNRLTSQGECRDVPLMVTTKEIHDLACTFQGMGWIFLCEKYDPFNIWNISILRERNED